MKNVDKVIEPTKVNQQIEPTFIEEQIEPTFNWLKNKLNQLLHRLKNKLNQLLPTEVTEEQIEPTFTQKEQALRGFARSYEISLTNRQDPLIQLQSTRSVIKNNLLKVLNEMKGLKFNETLKITFEKQKGDELIEKEAYFNAKPQTVTNETEIANLLQITQQQIVNIDSAMDIRRLRMDH